MRSTKQNVKVGRAVFPRLPKHAARHAATASGGQGRVTRARDEGGHSGVASMSVLASIAWRPARFDITTQAPCAGEPALIMADHRSISQV